MYCVGTPPPSVLVAFSTRSTTYPFLYVGHVALSYVLFWIPILFIPIHQQRLTRVNGDGYISFALKCRPSRFFSSVSQGQLKNKLFHHKLYTGDALLLLRDPSLSMSQTSDRVRNEVSFVL